MCPFHIVSHSTMSTYYPVLYSTVHSQCQPCPTYVITHSVSPVLCVSSLTVSALSNVCHHSQCQPCPTYVIHLLYCSGLHSLLVYTHVERETAAVSVTGTTPVHRVPLLVGMLLRILHSTLCVYLHTVHVGVLWVFTTVAMHD